MRLFLLLALLSLVAAAPLTTCEDAVDSATEGLEPTAQPATVEQTGSQEEESDEEKFEIEKENAFESFRTIHKAEGGSRANTSTPDEKFEKQGDSAGVKASSPKEANEKHKVQRRRRSPTEEKCSSQTEVESGSAEDAKDKSLEKASEASKETKEKTKESKEQQRRRRSPAKKEDSDDTVKETTKFTSGATESSPLENKEKNDGERTRRVLEGQETSSSGTETKQGSAKKGSRGQVKPPPEDGHIVREKPVAQDVAADDTARGAMATGHMAAIHTLETIGKRMREKSSN